MKNALCLSILALAAAVPSAAGPVLTLDPPGGTIQGAPGSTVGWGFTLTSDSTSWISVVTSALIDETNPLLGTYTDFAGLLGGPDNGVLDPNTAPWTEAFDNTNMLGIGAYVIDPGAVPGDSDSGLLDLNYEAFSTDPNICPTCATGFFDLQVPFEVDVTASQSAPEPSAAWLIGLGLLLIWRISRRAVEKDYRDRMRQ